MDTSALSLERLPIATRTAWERLRDCGFLHGFVLIGGTALAMRISHRISEDLDLAFIGERLPDLRIREVLSVLRSGGFVAEKVRDIAAEDDFLDAGLDLDDFQQNFAVASDCGTTRLSFVRLDPGGVQPLSGDAQSPLRVATVDEVFRLKVYACSQRSKARDWFDLYVLMSEHGYRVDDMREALSGHLIRESLFDVVEERLRKCRPAAGDEGYAPLVGRDAPTTEMMRAFFAARFDDFRIAQDDAAIRRQAEVPATDSSPRPPGFC